MKHQINGIDGVFEAEKLALAVLQDYCSKNECTFNELKEIFPDEVQGDKEYIKQKIGGNTGVFDTLVEAKDREDYFASLAPITIKDATIVVSNQWGERNLPLFIEKAEAVGYSISLVATEESTDTKHYTYIKTSSNENSDQGFPIVSSCVVQTNGKYTLIFNLSHDGDGVMDQYYFYDIQTKIGGSNGSPWDFMEFTDVNEEWVEAYGSFEDFGLDSDKISETLYNMRLEFIKTYLNETSDFVPSNAAIPSDKRDILKKEVKHDGVDYFTGNLVFEEGDENIIPLDWARKIK
ncbi:MAG: hypothetical protein GY823_10045 [Flavobacteriaceae bacterium]|nr:hypothetical protein [Flavobacteriaceae bacterium]